MLLHSCMCLLANVKCNELGIYFKMSAAYNNRDIQPHGHCCHYQIMSLTDPSLATAFLGIILPQMLLISTHSIHSEWSMASSAMWKQRTLAPLWGNPIHQKSSQTQKTFWVLPHMRQNWYLIEDQGPSLMSFLGLESITARLQTSKPGTFRQKLFHP